LLGEHGLLSDTEAGREDFEKRTEEKSKEFADK